MHRRRPRPAAGSRLRAVLCAASLALLVSRPVPSTAAPSAPSGPGQTFSSPGATLWYEVRGSAPGTPLVLVNGGPGFDHTYELCSDAWDRLAAHRRVVLWDQRGTGRSAPLKPGQSCTLQDQVADLEALRARLGAERIDLLGHSWGGYLVMAYASLHPERVAHLVICDSAAPKWSDTEFLFKSIYPEATARQEKLDSRDALGDSSAAAASMHAYLGMLFVSPARRDEFLAGEKNYRFTRAVNELLNADLGKYDLWPLLPDFTMPTLVLTGRFDINVSPATAWKIHQAIPGSRFVVFEASGHLPFFEEPDAFLAAVEPFLGPP